MICCTCVYVKLFDTGGNHTVSYNNSKHMCLVQYIAQSAASHRHDTALEHVLTLHAGLTVLHAHCCQAGASKPAFHVHAPRRIDSCWELRGRRPQSQGQARRSPGGSARCSSAHTNHDHVSHASITRSRYHALSVREASMTPDTFSWARVCIQQSSSIDHRSCILVLARRRPQVYILLCLLHC